MKKEIGEVPHLIGLGVFDGLSARVAERSAVDFAWLSSFSVSASLGREDNGSLTTAEMLNALTAARRSTSKPIFVDLDSGHVGVNSMAALVGKFLVVGADAVCIEDNPLRKTSSLYEVNVRRLVTARHHAARISACRQAFDRSRNTRLMLIARTEALVAGLGVDEALCRADKYVAAGAHAIFVQTRDSSGQDLQEFLRRWRRRTPVVVAPTMCERANHLDFFGYGASHVIFANQLIRIAHRAMNGAGDLIIDCPNRLTDPGIATNLETFISETRSPQP